MYVPSQSPRRNAALVAMVFVGLAVFLGSCGLLGVFILKNTKQPRHIRAGGPPKLLTRSDDGWSTYLFPDCGFKMETAGPPVVLNVPDDPTKRYATQEYTAYKWKSKTAGWDLNGYWSTSHRYYVDKCTDSFRRSLMSRHSGANITSENRTIDGQDARVIKMEYSLRGHTAVLYAAVWVNGDAVFYVQASTWQKYEETERAELTRTLDSIHSTD